MFEKPSLTFLAGVLVLAMTPMAAEAQGSPADSPGHEPLAASQPTEDLQAAPDSGPVLATLRLSYESAGRLAPPTTDSALSEETSRVDDTTPLPAAAKGSATGLGLMIGGAAAVVGGLLIGGTAGDVIAVGGVVLGVWGIIVYF